MTTKELLALVQERGLTVVLVDGRPVLRGTTTRATDKLLKVLKLHRERIVKMLTDDKR